MMRLGQLTCERPLLVTLLVVFALLVVAQPASARSTLGPETLRGIGIDQRLEQPVPLDLRFADHRGHEVKLGDHFGDKPVVLALVYNACPMLCNQVLAGMNSMLKVMKLDAGIDFEVVVVSFDPNEAPATAARARAKLVKDYGRASGEQSFHFLTGKQESIHALTTAAGFRYEYDEQLGQYAHPSALMVLTPDGRMARYFYGTEYSPRDVRLALVEAADGKVGDFSDDLLLLCYRYDPESGTYSATAINAIRVGGTATVAALGLFIGVSLRRERRRRRGQQSAVEEEEGA